MIHKLIELSLRNRGLVIVLYIGLALGLLGVDSHAG
jgi:Cu/Ag efflux pump CusA